MHHNTIPTCRRINFSRMLRAHVWDMTYGRCWYCGDRLNPFSNFVIEHIVPLARGGSNDIENLAPSCSYCNIYKATQLLDEWREEFGIGIMGYGVPDPNNPAPYWFECQNPEIPHPKVKNPYTRQGWRDLQIQGYYAELLEMSESR